MSPSSKHARDAARARAERQAAKRAAALRRKRQMWAGGVGGAIVVALIVLLAASLGGKTKKSADTVTQATPPAATSSSSTTSTSSCTYTKTGKASKDVGIPPAAPAHKTVTATVKTSAGTVVFTLSGAKAPCTTNALSFLASKNYFDATPCHRLTTSGIYVLQCGDPSGSGSGGPGFSYVDENLTGLGTPAGAQATYPAGTIAMANSGPNTNGSQFFLVYKDSPLAASYTPVGMITSGLDVVQKIAAAGVTGGGGDGPPKTKVTIETFTVA